MKRKLRMRKMLREDDLEELIKQVKAQEPEAEKDAAPKAEKSETPADKVLALQKTAGNSAVGAALERWAGPMAHKRSKLPTWPQSPVMLLGGEDPLPIESVQEGTAGKRTERDADPDGPGEFVVHMLHGKQSAGLHHAAVEGRHYAKVELVIPGKGGSGVRWILYDVYISASQVSGDSQTISLSYRHRELVHAPPAAR
jgi:hypothetical protein